MASATIDRRVDEVTGLPLYTSSSEDTKNSIGKSADVETIAASSDAEKGSDYADDGLVVDKHGIPLVPQPSKFRDDPLVRHQDLLGISIS